ncbi:MAG: DUF5808 domain-containing protein [Sporolactobacillus sp.]
MSTQNIQLVATFLVVAILFAIQPWMARKNILFGSVFADEHIWNEKGARRIIRRYTLSVSVLSVVLLSAFVFAACTGRGADALTWMMVALVLGDTVLFIAANRQTRMLKRKIKANQQLSDKKIIIDTAQPESIISPAWLFTLAPLPLAALAVAGLGYQAMPERLPVHFGFDGPDAWAVKSAAVVLQPIIVSLVLTLLLAACRRAPAAVKGSPGAAPGYSAYRKQLNIALMGFALASEGFALLFEISYAAPAFISPIVVARIGGPASLMISLFLTVILFFIFFRRVRSRRVEGRVLDDDARWIFGLFYFNRSDPSLFIEKRIGIGYTVNMAHPAAWFILLVIIALVILFNVLH